MDFSTLHREYICKMEEEVKDFKQQFAATIQRQWDNLMASLPKIMLALIVLSIMIFGLSRDLLCQ